MTLQSPKVAVANLTRQQRIVGIGPLIETLAYGAPLAAEAATAETPHDSMLLFADGRVTNCRLRRATANAKSP